MLGLCTAGAHADSIATMTALVVTSGGTAVISVAWGSEVTLTATVTSGGGQVTWQVNFCDALAPHCTDIHLLGTAQLTPQGAVLRFHPGIGEHSYIAEFAGTPRGCPAFKPSSSSSAALTVTGKYPTTMAITAVTGATPPYSITATVAGFGGNTAPAGTVSFLDTTDSNSVLGSASLGSGTFVQSFAAQAPYATRSGPVFVGVGDFNGDGIADLGGGINNLGTLTVTNGTFSGNSAVSGGGAIVSAGTLVVSNSRFSGNSTTGPISADSGLSGSAIFSASGTVTISNSTFSANSSGVMGGAILAISGLTVSDSTVTGNYATTVGGGILSGGTPVLSNTIVTGNECGKKSGVVLD